MQITVGNLPQWAPLTTQEPLYAFESYCVNSKADHLFCRRKAIALSLIIFLAHLKKIFKIEEYLAKEKNKLNLHLEKWEKLLETLS